MTLKEQLKEDLKVSMKSGETVKRNIIRLALSEIAAEDSRRTLENHLDEAGARAIIKKMVNNLSEIPEDKKTDELRQELTILSAYLPTLMSEDEIRVKIEEIIIETGAASPKEMGKVMGQFNAKYKGLADNKIVSEIVRSRLT